MKSYNFPKTSLRARCVYVVDGDTADFYVDTGFHSFRKERFRFSSIDTPELRDRDESKREAAKLAKTYVIEALMSDEEWPLRIETEKDPDSFGRYLCMIYFMEDGEEVCLNDRLVEDGHAIYKTY